MKRRDLHFPCSECGGAVRTRVVKEFEREGTCVSVAGIRDLVCAKCGKIYFPGCYALLASS